ncbi:MAG: hypothetical protein KAT93_04680 [Desulfuromonadales bacterium]|nr:hypothetical protein [Desulfuromonadales bacterium]
MRKRPRPLRRLCLPLGALLLAGLCLARPVQAAAPEWSGSFKSLDLYGETAPADTFPSYKLSSNRFRLNLDWALNETIRLESSFDYQLLWTNPAGVVPLPSNGVNRKLDLDTTWQHDDAWSSRLQLDHLNLHFRSDRLDVVVGRQAIGFGRIVIFSPLDIIAPFPPDALDTDVRPGIDAIRLTGYYGFDGQLGGIFVWGDEPRHNSWLLTWSDNRHGLDLLAISGRLRDHPMLGFGVAGSLGTLGLKGEIAFYDGQRTNEPFEDLYASFAIGAMEAWYRFDNGLTLIGQYLYNGPGTDEPRDYPTVAASAPLNEGLTSLLGRNYLLLAPSYQLHPLATLQGLIILNLDDDSLLVRPTLSLDLVDNFSLEIFWAFNAGKSPQTISSCLPSTPRSEFGTRSDGGGIFLKYYF